MKQLNVTMEFEVTVECEILFTSDELVQSMRGYRSRDQHWTLFVRAWRDIARAYRWAIVSAGREPLDGSGW